jgi:hypothetical protein
MAVTESYHVRVSLIPNWHGAPISALRSQLAARAPSMRMIRMIRIRSTARLAPLWPKTRAVWASASFSTMLRMRLDGGYHLGIAIAQAIRLSKDGFLNAPWNAI